MLKKIVIVSVAATLTACAGTQKKLTSQEQATEANRELTQVYNFVPDKPMRVYDVISNVLLRNQDIKTKQGETDIAKGERLLNNLGYLPQLTASIKNNERDRLLLTTSARLGEQPIDGVDTTPSFSSPRETRTEDLRLSYDILNIWKNTLTGKQKRNQQYIAELNRERAAQNIFRDTLPAYYMTAIYQQEGKQLEELGVTLNQELDSVCAGVASYKTLNVPLAESCKSGLSSMTTISTLVSELKGADTNLHALMSVRPKAKIELVQPVYSDPGAITLTPDELTDFAIANRPELGVELYKERNAKIERSKAWVDLLPSIELSYTDNSTDNPFTVNQEWEEESLNVTWNILTKVIGAPFKAKQAKLQGVLAKSRFKALLLTVVTQIEIGHDLYGTARENYVVSHKKHQLTTRKTQMLRQKYKSGNISKIDYLNSEIDQVVSQMQVNADYLKMIDSLSKLYLAVGIPITPSLDKATNAQELAQSIANQLRKLSIIAEEV